jgi:hypothetical protein
VQHSVKSRISQELWSIVLVGFITLTGLVDANGAAMTLVNKAAAIEAVLSFIFIVEDLEV